MLLITTNLRFAVNEIRLYEYGFDKYNVSESTGLDKGNLTEIEQKLITYFNSDQEFINVSVYNQRDIEHLKDVKGLIQLAYRLQFISLAYISVYIGFNFLILRGAFWRQLARRIVWGSGLTFIILAVLGVIALVDFNQFFLLFHLVSFRNDLWQLYPGDTLLAMFPEGFFNDAALFVGGAIILEATIIGVVVWGLLRRKVKDRSELTPQQSG